ncbi:MAG: 2Fe-2S ferredoxin [Rhizobium sp.]|nr:2Fe-2S ferredoxin [Rhizobium sp.]
MQLRGHHFLCILTYRGYGYTPAFVENMSSIVADISKGRPVRLIEGPDDICNGLTQADRVLCNHDCGKAETREIDRLAVEEISGLLPVATASPLVIDAATVEVMRQAFATQSIRLACRRCSWSEFCTKIAHEGFAETRLHTPQTSTLPGDTPLTRN